MERRTAACTIVSKNYLAHARALYASFAEKNGDSDFYVLLVDENRGEIDLSKEPFETIMVREIGVEHFESIAFKYDVTELNTSVKPTFLKYLLLTKNLEKLVYLDPDIWVYRSLSELYDLLDSHSVLLTPHVLSPIPEDGKAQWEADYLKNGIFNLGFIAVSHGEEALGFLTWWESRCLRHGFAEVRSGLFVDQKWMDFAPAFLNNLKVLKEPGYNMAYWNLHERYLQNENGDWVINGSYPLYFYHFSGMDLDDPIQISKHQTRYNLSTRKDLAGIFGHYRETLDLYEVRKLRGLPYSYNYFSNGEKITTMARRIYAAHEKYLAESNPFESGGKVYGWLKSRGMLASKDEAAGFNSMNYDRNDARIKLIHTIMGMLLRILGVNRYTMLMKYISYKSILRNQGDVFDLGFKAESRVEHEDTEGK